ncbi:hypothetical protein JL721_906 [Aureococcus anophagefferens]|nr:hypothetical protein JL721_906 [Aureococcus anophagefferens]
MRQPSPRAHRAVQPTSAELVRRWRTRPRRPAPPCGASVLFVKTTGAPVPDANRGAEVDAARPRSAPARTHGIKNAYGYSLPTQPVRLLAPRPPRPTRRRRGGPAEAPAPAAPARRRRPAGAAPDFSGDDAAAARFKLLQSQGVTQRNLNAFAARLEAAADALGEGDARDAGGAARAEAAPRRRRPWPRRRRPSTRRRRRTGTCWLRPSRASCAASPRRARPATTRGGARASSRASRRTLTDDEASVISGAAPTGDTDVDVLRANAREALLVELCVGHPALERVHLPHKYALTDEERVRRKSVHEEMRAEATRQIEAFDFDRSRRRSSLGAGPRRRRSSLGAAPRRGSLGVPEDATREGNADLYSETNLAKRELIRDDPEILEWLDKWWIATQEFDDKDKDGAMDFEEYAYFHGRLKKWIHKWAGDRGVTLPKSNRVEAREQLEEDFAADSGESGLVLHEDFVNSIFELADMWTESVAKYEYVEFLKRGYAHVYKQHLDLDALNFPLSWRRYLDEDSSDEDSELSDDSLMDMPEAAVMEYIVDVYVAKMAHDASVDAMPRAKRHAKPSVADVALEILECREFPHEHGAHQFHVRVRSLARALQRFDGRNTWLYLFNRLVGCFTRNGRVRAIPTEGATFVARAYGEILPALFEARKRIPHGVNNELQRVMRGAKHQVYAGYVALNAARGALRRVHRDLRDAAEAKARPAAARGAAAPRGVGPGAQVLARPLAGLVDDLNARRRGTKQTALQASNLDNSVTTLVAAVDFLMLVANIWVGVHALDAEQRARDLAGRDERRDIEASHRESFRKSLLVDDPRGRKRQSGAWATAEKRYGAHRPPKPSNAHPYRQTARAARRKSRRASHVGDKPRRSSVARKAVNAAGKPPPERRKKPASRESSILEMSVGAQSSRLSGKLASRARDLLEYELFDRSYG